jgi:intein/homing endonuclease
MTIEELYEKCESYTENEDKEYGHDNDMMVMSYDESRDEPYMGHFDYVYRHKVSKDLYEIEDDNGNVVTVTEDHSVMVERDGKLIEMKPADIQEADIIISLEITK